MCVGRARYGSELHSIAVVATCLTWRYSGVPGQRHCPNWTGSVGVRGSNPLSSTNPSKPIWSMRQHDEAIQHLGKAVALADRHHGDRGRARALPRRLRHRARPLPGRARVAPEPPQFRRHDTHFGQPGIHRTPDRQPQTWHRPLPRSADPLPQPWCRLRSGRHTRPDGPFTRQPPSATSTKPRAYNCNSTTRPRSPSATTSRSTDITRTRHWHRQRHRQRPGRPTLPSEADRRLRVLTVGEVAEHPDGQVKPDWLRHRPQPLEPRHRLEHRARQQHQRRPE
ncbi:hypothetical protein EV192_102985 [Actinocrispum wychmicini]|uniref:Tetratricopeptide repeat protein n=1 Tax=Actinocrispum wychmicini TaxID=1213861 RepID=A0A4R2JZI8_9PSEU|nr:hypothetical protein EV192_102985 [Actinocrispum wychmicini]